MRWELPKHSTQALRMQQLQLTGEHPEQLHLGHPQLGPWAKSWSPARQLCLWLVYRLAREPIVALALALESSTVGQAAGHPIELGRSGVPPSVGHQHQQHDADCSLLVWSGHEVLRRQV